MTRCTSERTGICMVCKHMDLVHFLARSAHTEAGILFDFLVVMSFRCVGWIQSETTGGW